MGKRKKPHSLFFFFHLLQLATGDVHSISGFFIGSQGLNLPDYMERITVDDVTMYYYDSNTNSQVPCPEWLNTTEGRQHWEDINHISLGNRYRMASRLQATIQLFNLTGSSSDVNIFQGYTRCELYPDGTHKSVYIHAFNGKDFLSFDVDRNTFTTAVPQAVTYKRQVEENKDILKTMTVFYKKICFERLKVFLQHAPALNKKQVPEVHLFKKTRSGSTVLTCHVTGFYPREVQVEWIGERLQSMDEEMMDVLPNGDGTYQTRRSVIGPEDQTYSCVVHHSSVAGNITKTWEHSGLPVWIWPTVICVFLVAGGGLLFLFFLSRIRKAKAGKNHGSALSDTAEKQAETSNRTALLDGRH